MQAAFDWRYSGKWMAPTRQKETDWCQGGCFLGYTIGISILDQAESAKRSIHKFTTIETLLKIQLIAAMASHPLNVCVFSLRLSILHSFRYWRKQKIYDKESHRNNRKENSIRNPNEKLIRISSIHFCSHYMSNT